jgi:serine phosphatase RsbU (regulator of sigma subunit)/pSer/pThr/pTyr-binding forkhead associated (FHA) protein
MPVLRAVKGLNVGQIFPIARDSVILGRHPECDVVLDAGAVSRQHARIVKIGDDYLVEDLRSRNGTFLNGRRVEGQEKLAENDQIKICDLVFTFHAGSPESVAGMIERAEHGAVTMVDDARPTPSSTIMSRVDVSGATSANRLASNPEVKLKALLEIGRNLGGSVNLDEVLPRLLESLLAIFPQADRGFIMLRDIASSRLVPKAVRCRREDADPSIRISRTIVNSVIATKEAVLSADAASDDRFDMSDSIFDFQIRSMMCAPLVASDEEVLGVIQVDARDPRRRFTPEDLEVLASVARQAAITVENAQLHELRLQEEVLQRELAVAHRVQQGLLPASAPKVEGYEFYDCYEPANHLGGDYFDYVPLQGGRLAVALADVSGKGISAALLMARLSAEVRYCLASYPSAPEVMARLNHVFCESRWEDRFVTLALAVLDPARHEACLVNAGHLSPILRHPSGALDPLGDPFRGFPLGVDPGTVYEPCTVALNPGDMLLMYTDGVPDAMDPAGELFGHPRLLALLEAGAADATALGERILGEVRRFAGSQPQSDDMCVTILRRIG